jgi:hypothetical protein
MHLVNRDTPEREADVTRRLVDAIARDVWKLYGGSGTLNWAGVERHLGRMVRQARCEARASEPIFGAAAAAHRPMRLVGHGVIPAETGRISAAFFVHDLMRTVQWSIQQRARRRTVPGARCTGSRPSLFSTWRVGFWSPSPSPSS